MKRAGYGPWLILLLVCAFLLGAGSWSTPSAQDSTAMPAPTAEGTPQIPSTPAPTSASTPQAIATPSLEASSSIGELATEVATAIRDLSWEQVLRLLLWVVVIVLAVVYGSRLVHALLRRIARRTTTDFDDALLEVIGPQIRWFIAAVCFNLAVLQLDFVTGFAQAALRFTTFMLYWFVALATIWRSIDFSAQWYIESQGPDIDADVRDELVPWAIRLARILLIFVATGALLAYFGVNLLGIVAALGIGGFAIGLAAKDTITNIISGVVIMMDKPFQVGDRIDVPAADTWGDVIEIGMRSTRVVTRDNRLVIVPNALLVTHSVVNYSLPDPPYRLEVDLGIGYNGNIPLITEVLGETVRAVDGVLADKPVDVLYTGFGDDGMSFRVRWWVAVPGDKRDVTHRVCSAIRDTSAEKGIELPDKTYAVINTIKLSPETSAAIAPEPVADTAEQDDGQDTET